MYRTYFKIICPIFLCFFTSSVYAIKFWKLALAIFAFGAQAMSVQAPPPSSSVYICNPVGSIDTIHIKPVTEAGQLYADIQPQTISPGESVEVTPQWCNHQGICGRIDRFVVQVVGGGHTVHSFSLLKGAQSLVYNAIEKVLHPFRFTFKGGTVITRQGSFTCHPKRSI